MVSCLKHGAKDAVIAAGFVGVDRRARLDAVIDATSGSPICTASTGIAMVRPPRSRIPSTAVLPTVPRPACSFLRSCLLASLPPM